MEPKSDKKENNNEEEKERILYDKNGIYMKRMYGNQYQLEFELTNEKRELEHMIHFDLVKIIYEINKDDIFNDMQLDLLLENHAIIYMQLRHFFADLGMSQKYIHLDTYITGKNSNNQILFQAKPTTRSNNRSSTSEMIPLTDLYSICTILNPHKVKFHITISFDKAFQVTDLIEKLAITLFCKLLLRTKKCIET
jgi:hypothetical protein